MLCKRTFFWVIIYFIHGFRDLFCITSAFLIIATTQDRVLAIKRVDEIFRSCLKKD